MRKILLFILLLPLGLFCQNNCPAYLFETLRDTAICEGSNVTLMSGYSNTVFNILWQDGSSDSDFFISNAAVNQSGIYTAQITDAAGCTGSRSVFVNIYPLPSFDLGSDIALCIGDEAILQTGLDTIYYSHQWNSSGIDTLSTFSVKTTATYIAIVQNRISGCKSSDEIKISFDSIPIVNLGNDISVCEGTERIISNGYTSPLYTYQWSTGDTAASIKVSTAGIFSLFVFNQGCVDADQIKVSVNQTPKNLLAKDTIWCTEDQTNLLFLDAGNAGNKYLWNTGDSSQQLQIKRGGIYSVKISDPSGCNTNDSIEVIERCPFSMWTPNAFTPNSDGVNDTWEIKGMGIESLELLIFNRWGNIVWQTNKKEDQWNGNHYSTGMPLESGMYVWVNKFTYYNLNGFVKTQTRYGQVTLLK